MLSCAKEQRPLPLQGFTCCLAMDGVKILASGFEMDEKVCISIRNPNNSSLWNVNEKGRRQYLKDKLAIICSMYNLLLG